MEGLERRLTDLKIEYCTDCLLAELTTFRVGGPADMVLYPDSVEECAALIRLAKEGQKNLIFLGNGSNMLGTDAGCRDWILKTDGLNELDVDTQGILTVGAGVRTVKASRFAVELGLSGLEFAHGIPGTMGGAVFMNAGAYGGSMDQIVVSTDYLDEQGVLHTLDGKDHDFGYRKSFFMQHPEFLIVRSRLQLQKGDPHEILAVINDLQKRRREKQPLEFPSAGSTFKRPEGYFAGKLIEDAGLKGYRIGGAEVSEKHAGFVINRGDATGADVRALIAHIQKTVFDKFGVHLECEIRSLGS